MKGENDDQTRGLDIVRRALQSPVRQIAENAGWDGAVVAGKLLESKDTKIGFNAQTETYENLVEAGVIDPTKVVRTALQDAASRRRAADHHRGVDRRRSRRPAGPGHGRRRNGRNGRNGLLVRPSVR